MHRSFTLAINGTPWECIPQMDGAVTGVLRFNKYNLLKDPLFYIKNEANVRVDDILGTQDITDIDIGPINCPDNKTLNQLMLWSADKIGSKGLRKLSFVEMPESLVLDPEVLTKYQKKMQEFRSIWLGRLGNLTLEAKNQFT